MEMARSWSPAWWLSSSSERTFTEPSADLASSSVRAEARNSSAPVFDHRHETEVHVELLVAVK
jgi:hypothetical protein